MKTNNDDMPEKIFELEGTTEYIRRDIHEQKMMELREELSAVQGRQSNQEALVREILETLPDEDIINDAAVNRAMAHYHSKCAEFKDGKSYKLETKPDQSEVIRDLAACLQETQKTGAYGLGSTLAQRIVEALTKHAEAIKNAGD